MVDAKPDAPTPDLPHLFSGVDLAQLLCSVQPSILTSTTSKALTDKAVMVAFRTRTEGRINGPERFDERMFASLYSNMNREESQVDRETPDEQQAQPPLSVGA